jgi:hypothetical protein
MAVVVLALAGIMLTRTGSPNAGSRTLGPRPVIDAAAFFNPASPTSGLQDAIDAAGPAGGLVVIPPGVYQLRRGLVLRSGITFRGSGPGTILRKGPGALSPLTADASAGATDLVVKDVTGFTIGDAIAVRDRQNVGWHIHHAVVKAVQANHLVLDHPLARSYRVDQGAVALNYFPALTAKAQLALAAENLQIEGDLARQPATAPTDFTFAAIHLVDCTQARVRDVLVTGWPSDGIGVQGGSDAQVTGCQALRCRGHGFHPGTFLTGATFTGNVARDNAWDGLFFCMGVRHTTVCGNVFSGNGWSGIGGLGEDGDEWNSCSSNICAGNGRAGIELNNGRNNTATGNVCLNNSRSAPGRWAGIDVSNCTGCLVTGNRCADDQTEPTQHLGIRESGRSDHNLLTGNLLHGSRTAVEKVGAHTAIGAE